MPIVLLFACQLSTAAVPEPYQSYLETKQGEQLLRELGCSIQTCQYEVSPDGLFVTGQKVGYSAPIALLQVRDGRVVEIDLE